MPTGNFPTDPLDFNFDIHHEILGDDHEPFRHQSSRRECVEVLEIRSRTSGFQHSYYQHLHGVPGVPGRTSRQA